MYASASEQVQHGPSNQNRVVDECAGPDPWLSARFEPDFLVPVQFFDLTRRRSTLDGETRLVFAVLEDAVRCYVKTADSSRRCDREQFDEVRRWFHAEAGIHSPFSFEYVCDVLGIVPVALRERLGLMSVNDLPTKQMRSVGRRQVVRAGRSSRKRSAGGNPGSSARGAGMRERVGG
ncbi:MAG: hypothetical protein WCE23_10945 [Candidatus Binatus sp.]|uniref:hypothetical protein n=1 Tax=Candidatus Binatus sp. TaxID=2811406 RepID=UPI003C760465